MGFPYLSSNEVDYLFNFNFHYDYDNCASILN